MAYVMHHTGPSFREFIKHVVQSKHARSYLEVGVRDAATLSLISCPSIGVDPHFDFTHNPSAGKRILHLYQMTSDQFFREYDPREILKCPLDVAFLDGLHQFEYLLRDFMNVEAVSHDDTLIMLDDCLPVNSEMTERTHNPEKRENEHLAGWWTGDVWKLLLILDEYRPDLHVTCVDTAPTGNVCITNTNNKSTILRDSYYEIINKYSNMQMTDDNLRQFYSKIKLVSGYDVMSGFEASLVVGP